MNLFCFSYRFRPIHLISSYIKCCIFVCVSQRPRRRMSGSSSRQCWNRKNSTAYLLCFSDSRYILLPAAKSIFHPDVCADRIRSLKNLWVWPFKIGFPHWNETWFIQIILYVLYCGVIRLQWIYGFLKFLILRFYLINESIWGFHSKTYLIWFNISRSAVEVVIFTL